MIRDGAAAAVIGAGTPSWRPGGLFSGRWRTVSRWGRSLTALVWALLLLLAPGCVGDDSGDGHDEFQVESLYDISSVSNFIRQAEAGQSVSSFALGWLVNDILNDISTLDAEMFAYFHRDGRLISTYMQFNFQSDPKHEIAVIEAMARRGNPLLREAALHALSALLYLPDSKDPPEIQAFDRRNLIHELKALRDVQAHLHAQHPRPAPPSP